MNKRESRIGILSPKVLESIRRSMPFAGSGESTDGFS
jgi:hypothetical protein